MGQDSPLGRLLLFIWISGIWGGFVKEKCTNYKLQFERVFSVPGDVAMLNSTLLSLDVLNFTAVPYNITWYNSKTKQAIRNQTGQIMAVQETLWFLNTTLDDAGEYMMILRTPSHCYMQSTMLVVDLPLFGECGRPRRSSQDLTEGVADTLNCPLGEYMNKLENYNITSSIKWYKGCDPVLDEVNGYTYRDMTRLTIHRVNTQHSGTYTCTLTFSLGGVTGSVSESIEATVKDDYSLVPQVLEPSNEVIKAEEGSNFTKKCLVFVPCVGVPAVAVHWLVRNNFIFNTHPSARIYTPEKRSIWSQDAPKGVWFEQLLVISELTAEDFNINYTCRAYSYRGFPEGNFTLIPADPNIILPIGLCFGGVSVVFIINVTIYYIFRMDIVLWFRRAFPLLYENKDLDGKLYDAYVIYPQPSAFRFSQEVEEFALHTLPQVLEETCGYRLFIAGRDCLPGQAIVDSLEENIQASRCILLLYTASTFISRTHTSSTSSNNNNISKCRDDSDIIEYRTRDSSSMSLDDGVFSYKMRQLDCVAAMHKALLEGSLKVVLVELEQIPPAHLDLFPESVLHLRKKQGAVCWWKNFPTRQRWRTCMRWREDEEKRGTDSTLSLSLSPSSRFWKEIRYHMPVRGRRVVHPENSALLNL